MNATERERILAAYCDAQRCASCPMNTAELACSEPDDTCIVSLARDELRRRLAELGMAEIAIPKKVVTMDDMPLLATGKIDYVALEETLGAHLNDS